MNTDSISVTKPTAGQLYRRLLSYVWPHKSVFALSLVGFIIFAASQPLLAHLMGVVEETLETPTEDKILLLVGALIATFMFRGVGTFLGKYFIAVVGRNVIHAIRLDLFARMVRLPTHYYESESSGRLISRVIFDVNQVTGAATRALTTVIQEGMTVILLMGYLIYLDYTLTFIFLGIVPLIGVIVASASRFFRRYSHRVQKSVGDVTQVTNDTIQGFREVRAFGALDMEQERFEKASLYNRRQSLKFELTNAISVPLTQQIVALGLGVMVYLMFQRVAEGAMSSAEFLQFITAASLIAKPLRALSDINSVIQKGLAAAESVFTVIDAPAEVDKGSRVIERARGDVAFDAMQFTYPGAATAALKQVDLHVEAGTSVAIVGRSGSGKTTLVNLLPRFYEVSQGQIQIDGIPVEELTLACLRDQIAIVSQQVMLFDGSVRENIAYGSLRDRSEEEIRQAAIAAHADEFIQGLPQGYDTNLGENGTLLSGGQRQRIAIARAILKDAPILILDEATSALDTESERHIQAALEEVMQGRTTFVIAHRLSTIESVDRILVMEDGCIVEDGSHQSLLDANGIYAQLHRMQFGMDE